MSLDPPEEIRVRWDLPPTEIDPDALKVVGRLRRFGYTAYLVGGCVRDLYLGLTPKDFDVVTSARPSELRRVFRNCRIIGRRFRLAHVIFAGKVIEVSTFRANIPPTEAIDDQGQFNVFGTPQEDALRRDFTVNALFYDPHTREIIDFVGGADDLQNGRVRSIGAATERFSEDPVRMIRALKLAGRLGFELDPSVEQALGQMSQDVAQASPARVLEELFKIFASGTSERIIWLLHRYRILHALLPELAGRLPRASDEDCLLWHYLRALDELDRGRRALGNAALLGAFLVPLLDPAGHILAPGGGSAADLGYLATRMVRHSTVLRHLPRRDLYLLVQLQTTMRRMAAGHAPGPIVERMMSRDTFADTFFLFWIASRALGLDPSILERWAALVRPRRPDMAWVLDGTSAAQAGPPPPPPMPSAPMRHALDEGEEMSPGRPGSPSRADRQALPSRADLGLDLGPAPATGPAGGWPPASEGLERDRRPGRRHRRPGRGGRQGPSARQW